MTIKLLPKVFKLTSRPVFTMLFTIKLSDCQTVTVKANIGLLAIMLFDISLLILCFVLNRACHIPWESTVYIYVEYSKIMLN